MISKENLVSFLGNTLSKVPKTDTCNGQQMKIFKLNIHQSPHKTRGKKGKIIEPINLPFIHTLAQHQHTCRKKGPIILQRDLEHGTDDTGRILCNVTHVWDEREAVHLFLRDVSLSRSKGWEVSHYLVQIRYIIYHYFRCHKFRLWYFRRYKFRWNYNNSPNIHWNQVIENSRCNKFSVGHLFTEIISHQNLS